MMKTTETIYEEMKTTYGTLANLTPSDGGDLELRLYAAAAQLYSLWEQADFILRQNFPQTATGKYLDYHGEARGVERRAASYAVGLLRFSLKESAARNIVIPAGTVCTNAAGTEFETVSAGAIPAGSLYCDVSARAVLPGTAGNVPADSITYMVLAPAGVAECTNPNGFADGSAAESDDSLRQRILASYQKLPNGANVAYYETQALNVDGVAAVSVIPKVRGFGTVDIVIASEAGVPSQSLINTVQEKLEDLRELCVDLQVLAPSVSSVNVSASITVDENYDGAAVCQAVRTAITEYFSGKRLGETIFRSKLGNLIYNVEGVVNYLLRTPTSDVSIAKNGLPKLGVLNITQAG